MQKTRVQNPQQTRSGSGTAQCHTAADRLAAQPPRTEPAPREAAVPICRERFLIQSPNCWQRAARPARPLPTPINGQGAKARHWGVGRGPGGVGVETTPFMLLHDRSASLALRHALHSATLKAGQDAAADGSVPDLTCPFSDFGFDH